MKRILITGKDSYIGTSFEKYLQENYPGEFEVDTVDMIDGSWREIDFSGYDTVFHVAGIAHADTGKVSKEEQRKYYTVNTDLTIETAQKAKVDGIKQFIFMSSIIVYGASGKVGETKVITKDTKPNPENFYGDSKLKAEEGIESLTSKNFKIAILRPPMIYGPNCKGNFTKLMSIAKNTPIFPDLNNTRSMIYIDNLSEFIINIIQNSKEGTFFPQNNEYCNTREIINIIAKAYKKHIWYSKVLAKMIILLPFNISSINKAFGSLVYSKELSEFNSNYIENEISFIKSI